MTQRNLYIAFIFTIISVYSVSAQTNRTKTLIMKLEPDSVSAELLLFLCQQKYDLSTLIILH